MRLSIVKYPFVVSIIFSLASLLVSAQVNEDLVSAQVKEDLGNKYYVSSSRQSRTTYENTLKSNNDEGYFLLGTIASEEEICSLFKHPDFSKEKFQSQGSNYVYVPIDRILEEFVSMLPFNPAFVGMHSSDKKKWATRDHFLKLRTYRDLGESLPDMTSTCLPIHLYYDETGSYSKYSSSPRIKWQEAYKDQMDSRMLTRGFNDTTYRIITDQRNLRDINIHALFFLKEMHPALIKRFDELHQMEVERLAQIEAKNLELEKEKLRLEAVAKAQAEAQEHERKLLALEERRRAKEAEEERLERQERAKNERLIEVEKIRLQQIEADEKKAETEARIRRSQRWDQFKAGILSVSIFSLFVYFFIRFLLKRSHEAKEQSVRLERERESRDREIAREKQKETATRWTKQNKKIQKEIDSISNSIEEINKQKLTLNKQIGKLELEKKTIEENISQLNDEIKGEEKIIKRLRKKYPFIDSYIENR